MKVSLITITNGINWHNFDRLPPTFRPNLYEMLTESNQSTWTIKKLFFYLQQQSNILKIQAESVVPSRCRRRLRRAATFRLSSVRIPEPETNSWIRRANSFSASFVATPGSNFLIWHLKRKFVYVCSLNNHKST